MKRFAVFLALLQIAFLANPALAQGAGAFGCNRTVATESWIEEWDPTTGRWVKVAESETTTHTPQVSLPSISIPIQTTIVMQGEVVPQSRTATRYAQPFVRRDSEVMLAQYGPFVVTSATEAAIVGPTDSFSPAHFDAMLRDFPQLSLLEMVEAPGTNNDIANLAVGRRIREAGIATHVPNGGSVRSGAVELFLAGAARTMDQGAEFAVHSWLDDHGREADDFAVDHPSHRLYLDYYVEMGMSEKRARDFYAMTNSVPHSEALWLGAHDLRPWLRSEIGRIEAANITVTQPRLPTAKIEWGMVETLAVVPMIDYGDLNETILAQLDLSQLDSVYALP